MWILVSSSLNVLMSPIPFALPSDSLWFLGLLVSSLHCIFSTDPCNSRANYAALAVLLDKQNRHRFPLLMLVIFSIWFDEDRPREGKRNGIHRLLLVYIICYTFMIFSYICTGVYILCLFIIYTVCFIYYKANIHKDIFLRMYPWHIFIQFS